MVADDYGNCHCGDSTIEVGGKCVAAATFAMLGCVFCVGILALISFFYMRYKNAQNDEVWQVHPDELHFFDSMEVIGQGSFGVVLLAVRISFDGLSNVPQKTLNLDHVSHLCSNTM